MSEQSKICGKCRETKPFSEFYKAKNGPMWACKVCAKADATKWRLANPERNKSRKEKWRSDNQDRIKKTAAAWHAKHSDENRERGRRWREAHPGYKRELTTEWRKQNPARVKELQRAWAKENLWRKIALNAQRRKREKRATPLWANFEAMLEFYKEAQRLTEITGVKHHVDHKVPLRSPIVCGLHCEGNLQVLTGDQNMKKGNRFWLDMPILTDEEMAEARRWMKQNDNVERESAKSRRSGYRRRSTITRKSKGQESIAPSSCSVSSPKPD